MDRELRLVRQQVADMKLDLSGMNVITECASGPYMFNALTPLLAGAEHVVAVGKDSRFGSFKDIKLDLLKLCEYAKIDTSHLEICEKPTEQHIENVDIITNSNSLRPIDKDTIGKLKSTSVIPLMWETWEFRDDCLDLKAALKNDILVLGTDESHPIINFHPYAGMLGLSLIFKLGLEGHKSNIIIMGGSFIGKEFAKTLDNNNIPYSWFVETPGGGQQLPYSDIKANKNLFLEADAIIVCELESWSPLFSGENWLNFNQLAELNPGLKIGVIAGNVDQKELDNSGISYLPKKIMPPGYVSYQAYEMGPRPIIELFAAGLKVGEAMARCRLSGMNLNDTIKHSLDNSPAMDFPNGGYMAMHEGESK